MAGRLRGLSQSDGRMREAAVREAFFRDEAGDARFLVIAGVCVNAPFPGGVEQRRAEIFLETSLCELLGAAAYSEPMGDGASLWLIRLAAEMPPPGVEESIAQAAELAEKETGLIFNFSVGRACVARAEIAPRHTRGWLGGPGSPSANRWCWANRRMRFCGRIRPAICYPRSKNMSARIWAGI